MKKKMYFVIGGLALVLLVVGVYFVRGQAKKSDYGFGVEFYDKDGNLIQSPLAIVSYSGAEYENVGFIKFHYTTKNTGDLPLNVEVGAWESVFSGEYDYLYGCGTDAETTEISNAIKYSYFSNNQLLNGRLADFKLLGLLQPGESKTISTGLIDISTWSKCKQPMKFEFCSDGYETTPGANDVFTCSLLDITISNDKVASLEASYDVGLN